MNTLPVEPAYRLAARADEQRWLVTDLWSESAVGIVGGEPKCCKSFLALDLAVAVASGTPALRRFTVPRPGRVLLYAAEDAQHIVRERLCGICAAAGCDLATLDVQVITVPTLRLDLEHDRERLKCTVEALRPRLLILDPFVRLHRIDENSSGEVAPLLAYLRELQRRYALAVLLVHHAKKSSDRVRPGQGLRGSSEFHAWGDSNLYLRRSIAGGLTLTIEHRAAASSPALELELVARATSLALALVEKAETPATTAPSSLDERIARALAAADRPVKPTELRAICRVRHAKLLQRLRALTQDGHLLHDAAGYRLASPSEAVLDPPSR